MKNKKRKPLSRTIKTTVAALVLFTTLVGGTAAPSFAWVAPGYHT